MKPIVFMSTGQLFYRLSLKLCFWPLSWLYSCCPFDILGPGCRLMNVFPWLVMLASITWLRRRWLAFSTVKLLFVPFVISKSWVRRCIKVYVRMLSPALVSTSSLSSGKGRFTHAVCSSFPSGDHVCKQRHHPGHHAGSAQTRDDRWRLRLLQHRALQQLLLR